MRRGLHRLWLLGRSFRSWRVRLFRWGLWVIRHRIVVFYLLFLGYGFDLDSAAGLVVSFRWLIMHRHMFVCTCTSCQYPTSTSTLHCSQGPALRNDRQTKSRTKVESFILPSSSRTMSTIARATSRIKRIPGSGAGTIALSRTPILRRQPILPSTSNGSLPSARSLITPSASASRRLDQRRWASSAAQAVEEVEEEVKEEVWPERILPTVSEKDAQRLKRQRNVGM
jgi:hypothetical protein